MPNAIITILKWLTPAVLWLYKACYRPLKVRQVRRKKRIKVAFVINSLGAWKTESLYKAMLAHERFSPMLIVSPSCEENDVENICKYLDSKAYEYRVLEEYRTIRSVFNPDIVFYQKPYDNNLPYKHFYKNNLRSLFCYVNYAFNSIAADWSCGMPLLGLAWQVYFENDSTLSQAKEFLGSKGRNCFVTGLPVQDDLLVGKETLEDPWKHQDHPKKRIIWACHHTVSGGDWIDYSTFMIYCDTMLAIAKKYKDSVQFAFKPHPLLRQKLDVVWGKEKTDAYFNRWRNMPNTQLELGKYQGLFKHSDAMVHDCGSFTIEYHYTHNPVMYLVKDDAGHSGELNQFARRAYELHYKGFDAQDIEAFIQDVIDGKDEKKALRESYFNECLIPPGGKSACENIIASILGIDRCGYA